MGQHRLMAHLGRGLLAAHGLVPARCCWRRSTSSTASSTSTPARPSQRLLDLGVVPVVNENDAIADDEIRFGDNDRLAALVAHLLRADLLVLLTDTARAAHRRPPRRRRRQPDRGDRRGRRTSLERVAGGQRVRAGQRRAWPRSWRRPRSPPGRGCGW